MNLTSYLQDKRLTVALKGEIDHHSAKSIMHAVANKIETYLPMCMILDFKDVTFMDSSGIAIVISALRAMRDLGGRLLLCNIPPQPLKVLKASGMDQIVQMEEITV